MRYFSKIFLTTYDGEFNGKGTLSDLLVGVSEFKIRVIDQLVLEI